MKHLVYSATKRPNLKLPNAESARTMLGLMNLRRLGFHNHTRSSSRKGVDESSSVRVSDEQITKSDLQLPIDVIVEILKRSPVKTLARFLCVSKLWGSIIRSRYFMKLFLAESSNRPVRLFFHIRRLGKADFVFSTNPGEDSVATLHLTHPIIQKKFNSSSCVNDLICYRTDCDFVLVVYNSTTKRSITLPKLEPLGTESSFFSHFLGFEPIDAVYKVLCVTKNKRRPVFRVLTLGNGNKWRMIEDIGQHHIPCKRQICTSGLIYYGAYVTGKVPVLMSFDLRSEKFDLIKGPATTDFKLKALTKYEGKLAFVSFHISADGTLVLWVLEDVVKHQWLKKVFVLPNSWTSLALDTRIPLPPHRLHFFLNITVAGEFILAPSVPCVAPFYVLYYDPKRNSLRKVSIQGILEHELLHWNREKFLFLYNISSSQVESLTFL